MRWRRYLILKPSDSLHLVARDSGKMPPTLSYKTQTLGAVSSIHVPGPMTRVF